jgi:ATP-dependent DNA helicase RecG
MTATPIPRTLALTIYGDLDLSILDEMPKGRKKIITKVVSPKDREKAYEFIRKRVKEGEQVFVICPRIEKTQNSSRFQRDKSQNQNSNLKTKEEILSWAEAKAVKEEYEKLSKEIFPDLKVEMLHGRMKPKEKEKIMKDFKNGKIDILVSTSVVEVGIDIPRATVMMIEGAERFGLAQLHQFRGRVGRSDLQSYCFLFTESPAKKTRQRLEAIVRAEDGFELAQKDLEIRGPGSLYGVKQWGIPDLAMENLKNLPLVEKTREAARKLLEKDSQLKNYPALKEKLKKFVKKIHLE